MRATLRLLASVKPAAAKYLEPFAPTGLTGLRTNPSPRSTLLYLYATTLDKLAAGVPETSVYRQSVEAVTRHRMALVEAVRPEGYDEWRARASALLDKHPGRLGGGVRRRLDDGTTAAGVDRAGRFFVLRQLKRDTDIRYEEWDGEEEMGEPLEGSRTEAERKTEYTVEKPFEDDGLEWEDEPQLTAAQYVDVIHGA